MGKSLKLILFLPLVSLSLTGCGDLLYLSKLGWHQSSISFHSIPVQEALDKKELGQEAKERIHFIQEVKRYGEERLGLRKTNSYSSYVEVKGPVLHIITASEKERLQLYRWDFPITGKVTYKGFFTREDILKEKGSLEARGYDTFVQQASAYSTLGWLRDPIFSSMLQQDESTLANLILHEMTHATIYFKGQTDLNEQIATFVGNQGAIDFLIEKYGKGSEEVAEAIHCQEDDLLFSRWIDQACQELSDFYAREASRDERLKGREGLFRRLKEDFKEMMASFKTESYKNFEKVDINNAVLLAYRRYIHRLDSFQILYEQLERDTRKVVEYFKALQVSGDKVVTRFPIENPESGNRKGSSPLIP
jgi:predicted aminopeptidase